MSDYYIDEMGLEQTSIPCPRCRVPLHYKKDQGMPFCWECTVDRIAARRARSLLARIKGEMWKS